MRLEAAPSEKIVMVDCPDPDNVLMALWVLKDFPDSQIAIVLSVRPVSFKAARYGSIFERLLEATGGDIHRMIDPLTEASFQEAQEQSWIKNLDKHDRAWFYVNPDLADEYVREDTRLYMLVSALRMSLFWKAHGIEPCRYRIYWDENSLSGDNIKIGMAHAFHVHDWSFDFNDDERVLYGQAIRSISDEDGNVIAPFSDIYREVNRGICEAFVRRITSELGMSYVLLDLYSLIAINRSIGIRPDLYLGGPFVDALTYVRIAPVNHIVAMGWNLQPSSTLFKLQFNVHVAPESADAFLAHIAAHRISLSILPTECVKKTVYALTKEELLDVFGSSPMAIRLNLQYHETAANGVQQTFALFDLVAALTAKHSRLFPRVRVKAKRGASNGTIEWIPDQDSTIDMFWPDEEHMKRMKPDFLDALRATVQ